MVVKIIEYLISFFLILECNSVFRCSTGINFHTIEVTAILLGILLILNFNDKNKKKIINSLLFVIFFEIFIFIYIIEIKAQINDKSLTKFIFTFGIVLPEFYILYKINNKYCNEIFDKYTKIMCLIALISLFFYIFGSTLNIIKPTSKFSISWGYERAIPSYCNLYFETQDINIFGKRISRNTGIFCESPMYSLNLTIALAYEILYGKKSRKRIILLLITIFTTISTSGIIIGQILFLYYYIFNNKEKNKTIRLLKILTIPIIAILFVTVSNTFLNDKMQSTSYNARVNDYTYGIKVWKEYPIFGCGYENTEPITNYLPNYYIGGLSNSIIELLTEGGIYLFALYVIPLIKYTNISIKQKKYNQLMYVAVIVYLMFTTIFSYRLLFINMLAFGFAKNKKRESVGNEEKNE